MTELAKLEDYLKAKGLTKEDLSIEEAFRVGQIAFIANIADTLGVSLTYNGLQWVDEIGKVLKERKRDNEFDSTSLIGGDLAIKLKTPAEFDFIDGPNGRLKI